MNETLSEIVKTLRKKADQRRERNKREALEKVEAEYLADIRSVERLIALDAEGLPGGITSQPAPANSPPKKPARDKIGISDATREAIDALAGKFTIRDVDSHIQSHHPTAGITRKAMASALNRFLTIGEIEMTDRGQGRDPSNYRKIIKEGSV